MTKLLLSSIFILVFIFQPFLRAVELNVDKYQYLSPRPGAEYVSTMNNIIIRYGAQLKEDQQIENELIEVTGSISGIHNGDIILYKDNKTLIFNHNSEFEPGEIVSVKLQGGLETASDEVLPELKYQFIISSGIPSIPDIKIPKQSKPKKSEWKHIKVLSESGFPDDFPTITTEIYGKPAPGYYFFSNWNDDFPLDDSKSSYLTICDEFGTPVYYRKTMRGARDFRIVQDNKVLFFELSDYQYWFCDINFNLEKKLYPGNGYTPDSHDLKLMSDSNYWSMMYDKQYIPIEEEPVNLGMHAVVEGFVIQELTYNGMVIFQWRSWDNFGLFDGKLGAEDFNDSSIVYDLYHINSIEVDSDTSAIISCRHLDEVTKIDRRTGEILWRLGGKKNEFEFINDERRFSHQHDARVLQNGLLTLFDNGNSHQPPESSIVAYKIDDRFKTAESMYRYGYKDYKYSGAMGNAQTLENGNIIVGWGYMHSPPHISELDEDGNIIVNLDINAISYRAYKFNWKTTLFETDIEYYDWGIVEPGTKDILEIEIINNQDIPITISGYHNHLEDYRIIESFPLEIDANSSTVVSLEYESKSIGKAYDILTFNYDVDSSRFARQVEVSALVHSGAEPIVSFLPEKGSTNVSTKEKVIILLSEAVKSDSAELWPINISKYFYFRKGSPDGEDVPFDAKVNPGKTEVELIPRTDLEDDKLFFVGLKQPLLDYAGNKLEKGTSHFSTGKLTSVPIHESNDNISVFPNPVNDFVNFEVKNDELNKIELIDIQGRILFETITFPAFSIDLSSYSTGIYYLRFLFSDGNVAVSCIVKN